MSGAVHGGGCLCGAVRYEVRGELPPIQFCHCGLCRRAQGAAFAANIPLAAADLTIEDPQGLIRTFESSPGKHRAFCSRCGSPLFSRADGNPGVIRLRVGTLDAPTGARPGFHIFADSHADWWTITDDLPRYAERPPA